MRNDFIFWSLTAIHIFIMSFFGSVFSNWLVKKKKVMTLKSFILSQLAFLAGASLGFVTLFVAQALLGGGFTGVALAFFLLAALIVISLYNFGTSLCLYQRGILELKSAQEIVTMSVIALLMSMALYFLLSPSH